TSWCSSPTTVNTERLWSASACTSSNRACEPSAAPIASIVAASRPSEKFGTDSRGSTPRTLGAWARFDRRRRRRQRAALRLVHEYYDRPAREYDDWYLGTGLFRERERPGWEEELAALTGKGASPPAGRT